MIPRREAKRFLAAYIAKAQELIPVVSDEGIYAGLMAVADVHIEESDDVLRGAENVEQKARRYLVEGRLTITRMTEAGLVVAECKGSGETYFLGYDPRRKRWGCTCQAKGAKCSHLIALKLVLPAPPKRR